MVFFRCVCGAAVNGGEKKEKKEPTGCCPNGVFTGRIPFLGDVNLVLDNRLSLSYEKGSSCNYPSFPLSQRESSSHIFLANLWQAKQFCFGQQPV
jgi:hypothetical protein